MIMSIKNNMKIKNFTTGLNMSVKSTYNLATLDAFPSRSALAKNKQIDLLRKLDTLPEDERNAALIELSRSSHASILIRVSQSPYLSSSEEALRNLIELRQLSMSNVNDDTREWNSGDLDEFEREEAVLVHNARMDQDALTSLRIANHLAENPKI